MRKLANVLGFVAILAIVNPLGAQDEPVSPNALKDQFVTAYQNLDTTQCMKILKEFEKQCPEHPWRSACHYQLAKLHANAAMNLGRVSSMDKIKAERLLRAFLPEGELANSTEANLGNRFMWPMPPVSPGL